MNYFSIQIKRILIHFPKIFLSSVIILSVIGFSLFVKFSALDDDTNFTKIKIGIVGKDPEGLLDLGISALQNLDEFRLSVDFIKFENEASAKKSLNTGKISAYAIIPNDYVNSLIDGRNYPVSVFFSQSESALGTLVVSEILDSVSSLITDTEIGIYTYHDLYTIHLHKHDAEQEKLELNLNVKYFKRLLARKNLFQIKEIGKEKAFSFKDHYICSGVLLFLFMWGLCSISMFVRREDSMQKLLHSKGVRVFSILSAEWFSYFILMILCFVPLFLFCIFSGNFLFVLCLLPIFLFCVSAEIFIAELCRDVISALSLNFVLMIFLSYISGFFYPPEFFPAGISALAKFLPDHAALIFLENSLHNIFSLKNFCIILIYSAILFCAALLIKFWRVQKND